MEKRGSRIHAVVELVCDQDELLSERVSTKLVRDSQNSNRLFVYFLFCFTSIILMSITPRPAPSPASLHTPVQVHAASGRAYNTSFDAPRDAGVDDVTGEPLEHSGAASSLCLLSFLILRWPFFLSMI